MTCGDVALELGRLDHPPAANADDSKPAVGGLALQRAAGDAEAGGGSGEVKQGGH